MPETAEVLGSEDWCGDAPAAYDGTWLDVGKSWCVRTLTVRADGMYADALASDLQSRFADFDGNYNSVDLGFGILLESDLTDRSSDAVVVIQARGC